jgi:multiple sugar transport system permease protein
MPLVGTVGRKRPRARFAMAVLYVLLIAGAITTLYPFVLMAVTGFKGPTDQTDNRLIPLFWRDDAELLEKYLFDKYAGSLSAIAASRTGPQAPPELVAKYERFLMDLPLDFWEAGFRTSTGQVTGRLTMRYQAWLRGRFPSIDDLNRAYIEENVAFQTVVPPAEMLDRKGWKGLPGRKRDDWRIFKAELPAEFRVPVTKRRMFQEFVRARFKNQIGLVPPEVLAGAREFEEIPLPAAGPLLDEFAATHLPERFANETVESRWARISDQPMPIEAFERAFVSENAGAIRSEMTWRNYRFVLDYILINGRALYNTFVFCLLTILTQLIVNPLAAYALSRYPIKASGKILIFLLATMAFPAEVAMIPSFLLLKDLGLLNTFAALVLPSMASGYMIFLLKGFFDSLPQELYESGQIDGAKETTMMLRIAIPLSKPVLGYMALLAFMGSYGAFMYAFLVAQDQRMWTLMVFIFQLQLVAPQAVMMAALTLAAIPTLVVFLLAQRVIMRGIVLPGER